MSFVFLSHSHSDKSFARKLAADLRAAGHSVWIDEAEIKIGDSLIDKIRQGLDQVDHVCALLSRSSIDSPWVQRELDIASNREIDERRVVVLPLLLEDVVLPGFLRGKFYGDFRQEAQYAATLERLIEALGPADAPPVPTAEELEDIKQQLAAAQAEARIYQTEAERAGEAAFRAKSERMRTTIRKKNSDFPHHSTINNTYAFEAGNMVVTLDYLLWSLAKARREGSHVLEALLTMDDKWTEVSLMLGAYGDMLKRQESGGR